MIIVQKSGTAREVEAWTEQFHPGGRFTVTQTVQNWTFRIDKTAIHMGFPQATSLSSGDIVHVAGIEKNGGIKVIAYFNETTGVHMKNSWAWSGCLGCLGTGTGLFFMLKYPQIGILFLALAAYQLYAVSRYTKAYGLISNIRHGHKDSP